MFTKFHCCIYKNWYLHPSVIVNTDFEYLCDAKLTLYQVYSGTDKPLFEGIQSNSCVKNKQMLFFFKNGVL